MQTTSRNGGAPTGSRVGTGLRSLPGMIHGLARRYWGNDRRLSFAVLMCSGLIIGAIWIVTLERIAYERADAMADASKQNSNLVLALEAHVSRTLKNVDQTLLQIVMDYREQGGRLDLGYHMREGAIDGEILHNVGVVDEHGKLVLNSLEFQPTTAADREYFRVHRDLREDMGMYLGRPLLGRVTGKMSLHASRRIEKADGSFGGVAYATLDPNYFTSLYRQAALGKHDLINIVGLDGFTRARNAGEEISAGQDRKGSRLLEMAAKSSAGSFISRGQQEGISRITSYRTLQDFPLVVAVGTSVDSALAEFRYRERVHYVGAALASATIVLFMGMLMTSLERQRKARGDLEIQNTVLNTQQEVSPDAILLVDENGRIVSYNRKFIDLWRLPETIVRAREDEPVLKMVVGQMEDPDGFLARVRYLYEHREERSSEELRTRDGRTLERFSAPVIGNDGRYHGRVWYFRDITDRLRREVQLRGSELRFRQVTENIGEVFWMAPPNSDSIIYISPAFEKIWGRSCAELHAEPRLWLDAVHAEDRLHVVRALERLDMGEAYDIKFRIVRPDGAERWVNDRGYPVRDQAGRVILTTGVASDITENMIAEERLQLSAKAFESVADGVIVTDPHQRIISVNRAFSAITGFQPEEILGKTPQYLQSGRHDAAFYAAMWQEIQRVGHWKGEVWDRRKNGEIFPELLSISAVRDDSGAITHYVGVCTDISSLKRYEEQLHHQAHHDALTGLPNRVLFQNRFREALGRAQRHGQQSAVLFLDLDHFKNINDSMGHATGDLLLQAVGKRLAANVREIDTVARFGGDEFAVLLDTIKDSQDAAAVAQKLLDALALPFEFEGHAFYNSVSIGISCYPQDGKDVENLFKNADTAMYRAKAVGRNNYQFFSPEMNARALENLQMSNHLQRALERDELMLHYQPCVDLKSGRVSSVEALVRWNHPELGLVPPMRFIPLAEETGLIEPIGEWVLKMACRQMRKWQDAGLPLRRIAVNLSARQFRHPELVQRIAALLEETRLPARCLELEVTESMTMQDPDKAAALLEQLKAMGIAIAIDDFGTGYSSLSYLKRFPIDFLKIDRSFVSGVQEGGDDAEITKAIIALAKSLNFKLIAEGVETAEQRAFLEKHGCDEGQGYLFSKPVPAGTVPAFFDNRNTLAVPEAVAA